MPGSSPVMPGATGHRYARASAGHLEGGFAPDPDKTFGRGWTEAFLDDRTAKIASEDAAKSMGEYIGEIVAVKDRDIEVRTAKPLANGDGLSFVGRSGKVVGSRAEVVAGGRVTLRDAAPLSPGMRVYRNYDIRFERDLENNMPHRFIDASISWRSVSPSFPARPGILSPAETIVTAVTEDGIRAEKRFADGAPVAEKPEAALESLRRQLGKHSGPFAFAVQEVSADPVRFYPAAFLNGIRRELASQLQQHAETRPRREVPHTPLPQAGALNRSTLEIPQELLRSRYCIRWEQGLCPRICPVAPGMTPDVQPDMTPDAHPGVTSGVTPGLTGGLTASPLYLVNNGRRLRLQFDCTRCEMTIQRWH